MKKKKSSFHPRFFEVKNACLRHIIAFDDFFLLTFRFVLSLVSTHSILVRSFECFRLMLIYTIIHALHIFIIIDCFVKRISIIPKVEVFPRNFSCQSIFLLFSHRFSFRSFFLYNVFVAFFFIRSFNIQFSRYFYHVENVQSREDGFSIRVCRRFSFRSVYLKNKQYETTEKMTQKARMDEPSFSAFSTFCFHSSQSFCVLDFGTWECFKSEINLWKMMKFYRFHFHVGSLFHIQSFIFIINFD